MKIADITVKKIQLKLSGGVVRLRAKSAGAKNPTRGAVLLSYTTLPFVSPESIDGHTNRWECKCMMEAFLTRGYDVDVIDFDNKSFVPRRRYDFCIDNHGNLERLAPLLGPGCVKIFHITTAHWLFQNTAEYKRLLDIKDRRGIALAPCRIAATSQNIEHADLATMLGNDFTEATYSYGGKKIVRIPISTTHLYPSPEGKNFEQAGKNFDQKNRLALNGFIWLGGTGMAHKGLDLVLEAFAEMPDLSLAVFGKCDPDFAKAYEKELYKTANIRYSGGWTDMGGQEFLSAVENSAALVYPSCSEGSSGGVVTAMHAGLIPIVSYQSGVNVEDFGVILKENTVAEIKKQARLIASLPAEELRKRAVKAWTYARTHHTRERFKEEFEKFVQALEKQYNK